MVMDVGVNKYCSYNFLSKETHACIFSEAAQRVASGTLLKCDRVGAVMHCRLVQCK